jgi:hypothetical protein
MGCHLIFRPSLAMRQNRSMFQSLYTTFFELYRNLTDISRARFDTSRPTQAPIGGMRTTISRGPAFFNSESQTHASQPRASGMGPASYMGAVYEGRRVSEHNRARQRYWVYCLAAKVQAALLSCGYVNYWMVNKLVLLSSHNCEL